MVLAVPVAVRFLQQGNQELSRNMSSYLSLAAIAKAELLAQHTEAITCSVLTGRGLMASWEREGSLQVTNTAWVCIYHRWLCALGHGDFTKCHMILDQHPLWSWNNILKKILGQSTLEPNSHIGPDLLNGSN